MVWDTFSKLATLEMKKKKKKKKKRAMQIASNGVCLLGLKWLIFNYLGCVWYYSKPQGSYLEFTFFFFWELEFYLNIFKKLEFHEIKFFEWYSSLWNLISLNGTQVP